MGGLEGVYNISNVCLVEGRFQGRAKNATGGVPPAVGGALML